MLQRGNAYHMGSHAGAWEPGKNQPLKSVNRKMKDAEKKDYLKAQGCLKEFIEKHPEKPHYLVEFTLANALCSSR